MREPLEVLALARAVVNGSAFLRVFASHATATPAASRVLPCLEKAEAVGLIRL